MATEQTSMPVNGNYAPPHAQGYGAADQTYGSMTGNGTSAGSSTPPTSTAQASSSNTSSDLSATEIGWYFVERYYNTLSRSPQKLCLFYNKRSVFVSGTEEEKVLPAVGQKQINDRITALDFADSKVRITNVDSQKSDEHIVIQVIGEITNKSQPPQKFVQTFVLATQTNGWFVLNDIFRFLKEEEDELEAEELQQEPGEAPGGVQEPAPTLQGAESKDLGASPEGVTTEDAAAKVDEELEEAVQHEEAELKAVSPPPAAVNGTPVPEAAEVAPADDAPAAAVASAEETAREEVAEAVTAEDAQPEKPKEPEPTPAPTPAAKPSPAPAVPTAAPKPAVPKTWANLAAAANRTAPAVPAATPAPAQAKAVPAPTAPSAAPSTAAAAPARESTPATSDKENTEAGWQTAGADHSKRQSRVGAPAPTAEQPNSRAYIKNVFEGIDDAALRAALSKFGKLSYLDISRQKNCAFVDFETSAGFQAAVAANPHTVNGETIYVEERRLRPGSYPYQPRGGMRGGRGGPDNRPGQGRGGFNKEAGRGGFTPRGRGGNVTPRGRGGAQAA